MDVRCYYIAQGFVIAGFGYSFSRLNSRIQEFANGGDPEVSDKVAGFITFYASSLAVPARRAMENPEVQQGARLVSNTGGAACHTPKHTTGLVADRPDLSDQTIWPSHFVARGRSRDIQGTVQGTIQD